MIITLWKKIIRVQLMWRFPVSGRGRGSPSGVPRAFPVVHGRGERRALVRLHHGHGQPALWVPRVLVRTQRGQRVRGGAGRVHGQCLNPENHLRYLFGCKMTNRYFKPAMRLPVAVSEELWSCYQPKRWISSSHSFTADCLQKHWHWRLLPQALTKHLLTESFTVSMIMHVLWFKKNNKKTKKILPNLYFIIKFRFCGASAINIPEWVITIETIMYYEDRINIKLCI